MVTKKKDAKYLKWEKNVLEAKQLSKSSKDKPYIRIAQLALEVCEISWGGAKKKIAGNPYTLTRFAKEIGVNPKTLSNYCAAYRAVHARIPKNLTANLSLSEVKHIAGGITKDTPTEEVIRLVTNHNSIHSYERKISRYMRHLRSLSNNFKNGGAALAVSEELLQEITFYCQAILKAIKADRENIRAKDNGLARKHDNNGRSIAAHDLGRN